MRKKKILITGAAGFLGLHLAKFFEEKDFEVRLLDIAPFNKIEYPKSASFYHGDIRNINQVMKAVKGVDFIIHAAAALPLWNASDIYSINIGGTKNLLQAGLINKVKRFVYISSTAVYGVPKKHPVFESDELIGVGPYGKSKIAAEKLCDEYRDRGLIVTTVRPKTFVGTNRLGVFEILFDWIKDGKKIPVIGSGKNRYQLLDVDDLVEGIFRIIIHPKGNEINTIFNIGARDFKSVKEDLQALFDYARSGSKVFPTPAAPIKFFLYIFEKIKISPLYQWVYDTADHDSFVSIDKLMRTIKWHPKYSNSEALIKAYQWYLDNYREIKSRPAGVTHTVGWRQGILGFFKRFL